MVGAGLAVLARPVGDRPLVTPGDQRVDEAVTAGGGDVGVAEPVTAPVVDLVGQPEVDGHVFAGDVACPCGVGLKDHTLLGGQQRAGPHGHCTRWAV